MIWSILQSFGFNERKLALSDQADAELIAEQVCSHVGCICERDHVESVRVLISSCQLKEPVRKRLRGDHHLDPLLVEDRISEASGSVLVPRTSMTSAIATGSKHSTRPLGIRHRPVQDQSNAHEKRDLAQRDKWARELYMELCRIKSPILANIEQCVGQERIHLAIAGKTRTSTLKRYVKCWQDWQHWKHCVWGENSNVHPSMFCEYLFSRFDEPCGPTIPGLICKAVHWFEKLAGLDRRDMVTDSRAVLQIRDYIVEQLSKDAPPPRRAPRYPVVMIEAMEKTVLKTEAAMGLRLISWVKLVKIWGSLRFDDVQKINPESLSMLEGRMTTTLRVTKTSGPGKRVQELPVCISEHAYIWDARWLKAGFDLLKNEADFDRDYLIPQLDEDWNSFRKKAASYNDMSVYACGLRRALRSNVTFEELIQDELASFWTEHSERATLPTGLAMIGVVKTDRDLVGRWKPDASDSYVRSYNGLVAKLQNKFANFCRREDRSKLLDEIDVLESAQAWLKARKREISVDERQEIVSRLGDTLKEFLPPDEAWVEEEEYNDDTLISDLIVSKRDGETVQHEVKNRQMGFVVVHNNARCRRLHKIEGGCWMAKSRVFKVAEEYTDMPEDSKYTHVCKVCWPKQQDNSESSEEDSSSTTSQVASSGSEEI